MTDIFGWQQQQQLRMQETEKKSLHIDPGFLIFDTRLGLVWFGWQPDQAQEYYYTHTSHI